MCAYGLNSSRRANYFCVCGFNLQIIELKQKHEIVSLVGTLSAGGHLHVALSDAQGQVIGGHVMGDMIVFTTAEIVVGDCTDLTFSRPFDSHTGFPELVVGCRD